MRTNPAERLLTWRAVVVWGLLMCSFLHGAPLEPLCAWLVVAGLLHAGARWSATVARESGAALLLLDAPVLFFLREQLPVPAGALLVLVSLGGLLTLPRALAALLLVEVSCLHTQLDGASGVGAGALACALLALGAWRAHREPW